jgi:threonyl-tRNA synthetase
MPTITLPDGSQRHYDVPVTLAQIAADIGPGLAKAAVAGRIDGREVDLCLTVDADARVELITEKDPAGIDVVRHSCAHLLGQAVKQLYPEAKMAIGPVVEDGFYYDIDYPRPFTPDDLARIEQRMHELAAHDYAVIRRAVPRDEAMQVFAERDEPYKVEILKGIPADEQVALYIHEEYIDMCRGPHVPNIRFLRAFRLTKLAGAYWRGDARNRQLQRIYGTCWPDKKSLDAYLQRLEEAEKRDHRRIAKTLDLFHIQEEAPGMVFWHDKGWRVYTLVQDYIRDLLRRNGYQEVNTPQIVDRSLWERSGHWEKFQDAMFTTASEDREYAIKPMNCPCHVQIFNHGLRSYRELPLRMAEFGSCHRNEPSGALHGLMRVRHFVQDDAHIFCTEDQIQDEVAAFIGLVFQVYGAFGFEDITIALSTRPESRVGSEAQWDRAELALASALSAKGLNYRLQPGEGAFYGPKIEFALKDCLGRVWQLGTIQLDFSMPERLGAEYVAEDNARRTPVMLHRAILGSLERFIGILIEHHAGALPVWLAPVQAVVMNITDRTEAYAVEIAQALSNQGIRVTTDLRNEKIGFKIREHTLQKVPYLLVVGDREMESNTVAVRTRAGEDLGVMTLSAFAGHVPAGPGSVASHEED